jgi:hypothetical protein
LTEAGRGLEPVIDAVTLWGLEQRLEPPVPSESVHAEPSMTGTKVWLNRHGAHDAGGVGQLS